MASVPLTMSVSVKEEVVVTGEAPVIDTAKTTIGVTGTSEQISRLPLARNFTSVATTAPGTGTDNSGGITFYGATGLENQYIIDGVNTTGIKIGNVRARRSRTSSSRKSKSRPAATRPSSAAPSAARSTS